MKKRKGKINIGTSGIVMPGPKQTFPPEFHGKSRLNYYSSLFNSIEINSSFYKIPMPATFEKWAADVPGDFTFTIKLWREITHIKELKFNPDHMDVFLKAAVGLQQKKGCLLVQFPGKINLERYSEVEQILALLYESEYLDNWRIAVEFRNPAWYVSETHELLNEYGASLVLHDIPKARNMEVHKNAPFVYLRLHGPKGDYRGSYSTEQLHEKFGLIQAWQRAGKDVYVYFNNTAGAAFDNALQLKSMFRKQDP